MTTPTNDRQTSERERLALLCEQSVHFYPVAAQLRADEAEIAQLTRLVELRSNEAVDNLDEAIRLRAENEALRTVTDSDVGDACRRAGMEPDYEEMNFMREALQSFIRSKEARRAQE